MKNINFYGSVIIFLSLFIALVYNFEKYKDFKCNKIENDYCIQYIKIKNK